MWRGALFTGMGGCLWISTGAHDDRVAGAQFAVHDLVFEPSGASACTGADAELTGRVEVGEARSGERFLIRWSVDGDEPVDAGALVADDGWVAFDVVVKDWVARPGCASGCDLPIEVTVDRLGIEVTAESVINLVPSLVPELLDVELGDPSGVRVALGSATSNTDGAYDVAAWPTVYFGLRDRHFALGLGGRPSLWYCPGSATPDTSPSSCVFAPMEAVPQVVDGEQVFVADTEFLGQRVCAPGGITPDWHAFGRIEGHVCGGPYTFALAPEPVVFVLADCDHDGVPAGADCNDLDPGQNPSAFEVCDGVDNDCDGVTLVEAVTLNRPSAPPQNFGDLQAAIDAATDEDELVVCGGTYPGPFRVDSDLTLTGGTGDPADVILTGEGDGSVIAVTGAGRPTVSLGMLTVTGGTGAAAGGGIDARSAGILTLEDCDVHGNEAQRGGGLAAAPITALRRTTIRQNSATKGGGVAIDAGAAVSLEASTIEANSASEGAGFHVDSVVDPLVGDTLLATLTLDPASTVTGNLASYRGGGLYAVGDFAVAGGSFVGNDGPAGGGGMMLEAVLPAIAVRSVWTVHDVSLDENTSLVGGGICAYGSLGSILDVSSTTFTSNQADLGGGILLTGSASDQLLAELTDVVFEYNAARRGGGLSVDYATVTTHGGHLKYNTADRGAGAALSAAVATFGATSPTDVEFNEAADEAGGILADGDTILTQVNGRISSNSAITAGGLSLTDATVTLGGSIEANVDTFGAAGLLLEGASSARLLGGAVLSGNDGSRVYDGSVVEACAGAVVSDVIGQGTDTDCFTITTAGYADGCGC